MENQVWYHVEHSNPRYTREGLEHERKRLEEMSGELVKKEHESNAVKTALSELKRPRYVLSSINIYMFQVKRPRYDHFRGIVCDNVPIFGTYVYLGMGNNVTELRFFKLFL